LLPQLSGQGQYEGTINVFAWMNSDSFKSMLAIAQNPKNNFTVFLPGPMSAFEQQAKAQCLTLKDWLNEIASNPTMSAQYVRSFFVKGAYDSSTFYDGIQLPMLMAGQQPGNKLVLGRKEV
jgi:hypothetical protein